MVSDDSSIIAAINMGIVGGQRAMTPLAAVAIAAARGELPDDNGALAILERDDIKLHHILSF
jgi:hypothetical protein